MIGGGVRIVEEDAEGGPDAPGDLSGWIGVLRVLLYVAPGFESGASMASFSSSMT